MHILHISSKAWSRVGWKVAKPLDLITKNKWLSNFENSRRTTLSNFSFLGGSYSHSCKGWKTYSLGGGEAKKREDEVFVFHQYSFRITLFLPTLTYYWTKLTSFLKGKLNVGPMSTSVHTVFQVKNYQVVRNEWTFVSLRFAFLNKLWPRSNLERK